MKVLPALAVAMLLACHASAQLIPVTVDPSLPDLYFEADNTAVEPEGRPNPGPPAPPVTTLAWASSDPLISGEIDCNTACNAYGLFAVQNPGAFLCRSSTSTSSFWYGSQAAPGDSCLGASAANAPLTSPPGTFLCGCCGTINRNGIPFSTGCSTSIGASSAPSVGGTACPAGPWGTAAGPNGFPAGPTAPAICAKVTGAGAATVVQWGSAYPPATGATATCSTASAASVPEPAPFSRVCFAIRPYTPPTPPAHGNKGRRMM